SEEAIHAVGIILSFEHGHGNLMHAITEKINATLERGLVALAGEFQRRTSVQIDLMTLDQLSINAFEKVVAVRKQFALRIEFDARRVVAVTGEIDRLAGRHGEQMKSELVGRLNFLFRLGGHHN